MTNQYFLVNLLEKSSPLYIKKLSLAFLYKLKSKKKTIKNIMSQIDYQENYCNLTETSEIQMLTIPNDSDTQPPNEYEIVIILF